MTFGELPRAMQVQLAAIGPLLFGLVCGFLLELSGPAYWVASALSAVGGFGGGAEHTALRSSALRGITAGACFGVGIVVAHTASGRPALAPLPSPDVLLILFTAVAGGALAVAGCRLSPRLRRRHAPPAA